MPIFNQDHQDWLDAIESKGVNLTVWEEEFIESIATKISAGRSLTENQADVLERIYSQRVP